MYVLQYVYNPLFTTTYKKKYPNIYQFFELIKESAFHGSNILRE